MATISVQAQLTPQQLMEAIGQLDTEEFQTVAQQVLQRYAQDKAEQQFARETELLDVIYQKKSAAFRRRFGRLKAKQRAFRLSPLKQNVKTEKSCDTCDTDAVNPAIA